MLPLCSPTRSSATVLPGMLKDVDNADPELHGAGQRPYARRPSAVRLRDKEQGQGLAAQQQAVRLSRCSYRSLSRRLPPPSTPEACTPIVFFVRAQLGGVAFEQPGPAGVPAQAPRRGHLGDRAGRTRRLRFGRFDPGRRPKGSWLAWPIAFLNAVSVGNGRVRGRLCLGAPVAQSTTRPYNIRSYRCCPHWCYSWRRGPTEARSFCRTCGLCPTRRRSPT